MPETVEDLGKLVKKKYPGPYDSLSDADLGRKVKTKYPQYAQFADIPDQPKTPPNKLPGAMYAESVGQTALGALKGAGHTALNVATSAVSASNPVTGPTAGAWIEGKVKPFLKPSNKAQEWGFTAEQFAEYFVPIPGVAELKASAKAPQWIKALVTAGREALDVGMKTYAQTKDPKKALVAAGVGGAVGGAVQAGVPAVAGGLKKAAVSQYAKVMRPAGNKAKEVAAEHIPEVLGSGYKAAFGASREGLEEKFSARADEIGKQLQAEYAKLDATTQTKLKPIYDDFSKWVEKNAFTKSGTIKDQAIFEAGLKKMDELKNALGPYLGTAPPSTVWEVRQAIDKYVYKNGLTPDEAVQAAAMTRRGAADAIRTELNSQHPTLAKLNNSFHLWRSMADLMQRNVTSEVGKFQFARNAGMVGRFLMGASIGGGTAYHQGGTPWEVGGAAVALGIAFESPAWRTVSAVSKAKIANLLEKGDGQAAADLAARLTGATVKEASK